MQITSQKHTDFLFPFFLSKTLLLSQLQLIFQCYFALYSEAWSISYKTKRWDGQVGFVFLPTGLILGRETPSVGDLLSIDFR